MYIIATISKAQSDSDKLVNILKAGANVLRYNFSYGDPEKILKRIEKDKKIVKKLNLRKEVKIMADLPGYKVRLGEFPNEPYRAMRGERIIFKSSNASEDPSEYLPINLINIQEYIKKNSILLIADGKQAFRVSKIITSDSFEAVPLNDGEIYPFKGVIIKNSVDRFDHLTSYTVNCLNAISQVKPEFVAVSFVSNATFLKKIKMLIRSYKDWRPKIVAKIETPLGIKNLEKIALETDIFLVARGDLGLTCPIEELGIYQKQIIKLAKKTKKEVIVSTHILDSMVDHYIPSRAEILDLTNIVLEQVDGIMLVDGVIFNPTPEAPVLLAKKIILKVRRFLKNHGY